MEWVTRKHWPQFLSCMALLMTVQAVWGATEIVERNVTSYGETRESAIVNALIEAISQIKGINIESKKNLKSRFEEVLVESNSQQARREFVVSTTAGGIIGLDAGADETFAAYSEENYTMQIISVGTSSTGIAQGDLVPVGTGFVLSNSSKTLTIKKPNLGTATQVKITITLNRSTESHESFAASSELQQQILSEAAGYVKSYEVISVDKSLDGPGWTAVLFVQIPKYVATGQDRSKMRTMAVLPFRVQTESYDIGNTQFSAKEFSWQLNHKLITELTQARKFRLLDREYVEEYENEKALLKSGEVPVEETLRLGQRLGSDFMITGVITDYRIKEEEKQVLGLAATNRSVSLIFEFRVIEVAPQEIRWSGAVELALDQENLKQLTASDDLMQVQNAVLKDAAATVASDVLEVIFPIKVLSIQEGQVTLNQGGIRIEKGQLFDIFTPGQKVVDPDTGRKIRLDGPRVGTVEVVSVRPKFSIARMIEGDIEQVETRAICRRKAVEEKIPAASSTTTNW